MTPNHNDNEKRHDYINIKDTLSDIKESLSQIVVWKEAVIERLVKIEENFKSLVYWKLDKVKECSMCNDKLTNLEHQICKLQTSQKTEGVRTNIFFEVLKYIMIAGVGAFFTWLVSKL